MFNTIVKKIQPSTKAFNIHVVHISPGGVKTNIGVNALNQLALREDSFYKPWFDSMIKRIDRTQGPSSLSAEQFAQKVVRQIVRPDPPRYMTLGHGAWAGGDGWAGASEQAAGERGTPAPTLRTPQRRDRDEQEGRTGRGKT